MRTKKQKKRAGNRTVYANRKRQTAKMQPQKAGKAEKRNGRSNGSRTGTNHLRMFKQAEK